MFPKLNAYGIFVDNEYATSFLFPLEIDERAVKITAALKSDPTIILDEITEIPNTNTYSVFVDGEYVDKIYQEIEPEYFYPINAALQSDPKIVWIETDYEPNANMSWQYINNSFIRNE